MSPSRACTGPKIFTGVLFFVAVVVLFRAFGTQQVGMSQRDSPNPLEGLKVSIEQSSTEWPISVKATVTNTNDYTVSILTYDSPLDQAAFALGLLSLTPSGKDTALELATVQFRRIWPPTRDHLVELAAGESKTSEIEVKPAMVSKETLGETATALLKGEWRAVWPKAKDDISDASLDNPSDSEDAFMGTFQSDELALKVD
ncbi:uncharacterized protein F5Z01DRAFT_92165 [Emericellopsis atlantica]|uniref:Uncharacterized protein n=1 Tax=Emericellopsis atlantica TaxID=2614577 RepID=A0A9P7ZN62_9HYPO|nr:uncharacterized protein F5Z01DRAFT_92165 [Emericellopsis atlantica]KAG9254751.1 hypothetical protein F5Z01DRAFT_92165 [Emericellopsis atlantica]